MYMYHCKMDMTTYVISLSATLKDNLTTKNGCVLFTEGLFVWSLQGMALEENPFMEAHLMVSFICNFHINLAFFL